MLSFGVLVSSAPSFPLFGPFVLLFIPVRAFHFGHPFRFDHFSQHCTLTGCCSMLAFQMLHDLSLLPVHSYLSAFIRSGGARLFTLAVLSTFTVLNLITGILPPSEPDSFVHSRPFTSKCLSVFPVLAFFPI